MQAILRSCGRRRALQPVLFTAALAIGLLAMSAESASAATCTSSAAITVKSYRLTGPGPGPVRTVTRLRGNVNQGDAIDQVTFTVSAACPNGVDVALVAYAAPGPTWDPATASRQQVVDSQASRFPPGPNNTLSLKPVLVPAGCFQVDLVVGSIITKFNPPSGTYSAQGRLVDADTGDPGCTPLV